MEEEEKVGRIFWAFSKKKKKNKRKTKNKTKQVKICQKMVIVTEKGLIVENFKI